MSLCISCKNRYSIEQCTSTAIRGTQFCGKHVRVKRPRIWSEVNDINPKVICIQRHWRGYAIRNHIKLAGVGVLNRTLCHNESELVSMDDSKSVTPLDYFSFIESGKVYWFDIRSLSEFSRDTLKPINPYTRVELTFETRQRLRKLCNRRRRLGLPIVHETKLVHTIEERSNVNWMSICQIIEENGFFDMSPLFFSALNRTQLLVFLTIITADMKALASEHICRYSRRYKYVYWLNSVIKLYAPNIDSRYYSFLVSRALLSIMNDCMTPYPICFIIMSSLYRL